MKAWQRSTVPKNRKRYAITNEQRAIFIQVISLLHPYSNRLETRQNTPDHYELWTKHSFRSIGMNPKDKRGVLFAGVLIMKKHIGLYFYPLHINSSFTEKIDPVLQPFWKGNSVFRFQKPLSDLTRNRLAHLFDEGWNYYQEINWVS